MLFVEPSGGVIAIDLIIGFVAAGVVYQLLDGRFRSAEQASKGPFPKAPTATLLFLLFVLGATYMMPAPVMGSPLRLEFRARVTAQSDGDKADQAASKKTTSVAVTTSVPADNFDCPTAPGQGVEEPTVAEWMVAASEYGASTSSFGCLRPAKSAGSSWMQEFENEAILIGSVDGAGVVSGWTLKALLELGGGHLTREALGGQIVSRFVCGAAGADIQALVAPGGEVLAFASRLTTNGPSGASTQPFLTPSSLVPAFVREVQKGGPLVGAAAPTVSDGRWVQTFIRLDGGAEVELQAAATSSFVSPDAVTSSLPVRELFGYCNPGAPIPVALP